MEKSDVFTHMIRPGMVLVVNDGGAKAPRWVDAGAGDGDGGQVDQEHRESDWERGKDLFIHPTKKSSVTMSVKLRIFFYHIPRTSKQARLRTLTGTWESLAFLLASVAEKTV